MAEYDYQEFDRIWDEKGQIAAHLSLPFEEDAMELDTVPMLEKDRCIHCGTLPHFVNYGPYRLRRSFMQVIKREPSMLMLHTTEGVFCNCWEPIDGYKSRLDYL